MGNERGRSLEGMRFRAVVHLPGSLRQFVDDLISFTVRECGSQKGAAKLLRTTEQTISRRLKRRYRRAGSGATAFILE
jgi:hypothetical protein